MNQLFPKEKEITFVVDHSYTDRSDYGTLHCTIKASFQELEAYVLGDRTQVEAKIRAALNAKNNLIIHDIRPLQNLMLATVNCGIPRK